MTAAIANKAVACGGGGMPRRRKTSPTQRSIAMLLDAGYAHVEKCEHWNAYARRTIDLLGCIDILAIDKGGQVVGVQTTTHANMTARIAKILALPQAYLWALGGNKLVVHGWRKLKRGRVRAEWVCDARLVTVQDFNTFRAGATA